MDLSLSIFVALLLLVTAVAQIVALRRTWQRAVAEAEDRRELDYRRRQFRRRMQTSVMLAVLAVSLPLGQWLTGVFSSPWFSIGYWLVVLVIVLWMLLLAGADILATKLHYGRRRDAYTLQRTRLEVELQRRRAEENGEQ